MNKLKDLFNQINEVEKLGQNPLYKSKKWIAHEKKLNEFNKKLEGLSSIGDNHEIKKILINKPRYNDGL
jgi:hypothetical protein